MNPTHEPRQSRWLSADALGRLELPPPRWAVAGIVPEGASMLAGRPKLGKSWLALNLAVAVASGGQFLDVPVEQGPVLYLALEDGQRRIQGRLHRLLDPCGAAWPSHLHFTWTFPVLDADGLKLLAAEIKHVRPRLLIVDTLGRVRPVPLGSNAYQDDYRVVGSLQQLALNARLAIVLVAHTRKRRDGDAEPADPLDEVNGTTGVTGAADVVLVLSRKRHGNEGKLFLTGRDVEERQIALRWDAQNCLWSASSDLDDGLTDERRRLLQLLRRNAGEMDLDALAAGLGKEYAAVNMLASRMVEAGLLTRAGRGRYRIPGGVRSVEMLEQAAPN